MCGIVGIIALGAGGRTVPDGLEAATQCLACRGPDHGGVFRDGRVALGHRRLAVIDTSEAANQPMTDPGGRYTIVYNGEVYNFRELRERLVERGVVLKTRSDTEVVLQLFIAEGTAMLERLNGFFALAIYDREQRSVLLARDRFGIKPLLVYRDSERVMFASEMKALLALPIRRELDEVSLFQYLQLSYIPAPHSILKHVSKLEPGCYLTVTEDAVSEGRYARAAEADSDSGDVPAYDAAARRVAQLLDASVARQMVSDVPLGAFLSGGLDSTIVAALAARHTKELETYAIGFPDHPRFDESADAEAAARALGVRHTTFPVSRDDLYAHLFDVLDYTDEPFSDSSALAVYILSRHTRRHVTVALSGDGADEIFGGYNKHAGEYAARNGGLAARAVRALGPLWRALPHSRETSMGDTVRRLDRFARRASLGARDRYWSWCTFTDEEVVSGMLAGRFRTPRAIASWPDYLARKDAATQWIEESQRGMNDVLRSDIALVLPNDMLRKVDSMSMAHGLEIRVPFLDNDLVAFASALPSHYKIGGGVRKRILRDAFRAVVPEHVLKKRKHGFEVPLMPWFRSHLRSLIRDELLSRDFVVAQGLFDPGAVSGLLERLDSDRPGDIAPQVWSLVVLQYWWKRYMV